MFERYPKTRPALPTAYQAIYLTCYLENRGGRTRVTSLAQKMESWMHKKIAADVRRIRHEVPTLEIGAGILNHLPYEPNTNPYDIIEPFKGLLGVSKRHQRIRTKYCDITEVPPGSRYQRILSIATLEHVLDLPNVVAQVGQLLSDTGHFRVGVPSEGTRLWKAGWMYTTGLEFKLRYGLDYGVLMAHEHVNTAQEVEEALTYFFASVTCQVFGLSKRLSFYRFYDCANPQRDRCGSYLRGRSGEAAPSIVT